jgi:phasin family protein
MMTVEQVMASHKASIETFMGLSTKAFEGLEKIIELNVTASKAALVESSQYAKAVLNVKDAQELSSLQTESLQPIAEKAVAYSRHLYDIASSTSSEFTKSVEGQVANSHEKFMGMVDAASKNAPAGSESAVALVKTAVAAANNAFETVQKAVKQASEVAETNFKSVAEKTVNNTRTNVKKSR